jgi:tetratricopeptide (TPR) repeat protein
MDFYAGKLGRAPENARYNHMLAALSTARGDNVAAVNYYRASIASSDNVMTRNDLALHKSRTENLRNLDKFKECESEFKKALVIAGDDHVTLHKNIGALYGAHGDFTKALTHTKRALEVNPTDAALHRNMSKLMDVLGDQHSALKHNMEAMHLDTKHRSSQNSRSYRSAAVQNLVKGGDLKDSVKLLSQARNIELKKYECPTSIRTQEIISKIMKRCGDPLDQMEKEQREFEERKAMEDAITKGSVAKLKPSLVRLGCYTREGNTF